MFLYMVAFVVFIPSAWQKVLVPHWDPASNDVYWTIHRNKELVSSAPFKVYLMIREVRGGKGFESKFIEQKTL
jgi:hypothetical protein